MKLQSLYVKRYKNLVNFSIDFLQGNGLSILAGNNGSGKSNLLEVISGIFHDLFLNKRRRVIACDYRLAYEFNDVNCKIEQCQGEIKCFAPYLIELKRFVENYAPSNVIGLYSGEEERLWVLFYEYYYNAYMKRISGGWHQDYVRLLFIDKKYWSIALLTLLLSSNKKLRTFIEDELRITAASRVEIDFDVSSLKQSDKFLQAFVDKFNPEKAERIDCSVREMKQRLSIGSEMEDYELFRCLAQAYLATKRRVISRIAIKINGHFEIGGLSEGEKKLILVKAILEMFANEKTLVLMDEPDAHLHEMRKERLYGILSEHDKCQIVVASHSPTIIEMAPSDQIIVLKQNTRGNAQICKADKVETLRLLTGSRMNAIAAKPLLYCEGNGTSVENRLYPVLFPEYTIIPVGGHAEVISHTKTFNTTFAGRKNYAIGIIDWDYRTSSQKQALREQKIYVLDVVEIENVLMDLALLQAAQEQFCSKETAIDDVKKTLFDECKRDIKNQATKYAVNDTMSKIIDGLSPDGGDIRKFKDRVKRVCDVSQITRAYNDRLKSLRNLLNENKFEDIVRIYDFRHNIDRFVSGLVNMYRDRILILIHKRADLRKLIRDKYYSGI